MSASLEALFSYRNISKAFEKVKTGIPDVLPSAFSTIKEQVYGNETTATTFYGERRLVKRIEYGSPTIAMSKRPIGQQSIILSQFGGHIKFEQELLLRLRGFSDLLAMEKAKDVIARGVADHKKRFENNRIAHMIHMLSFGALWYSSAGALQTSSSGAVATQDFGVPAGNQNQVSGIVDASWATTTTNIFMHFEGIKQRAAQLTGFPLKHAFYGKNIPQYIYKNDSLKHYFQFNPTYYQALANNPGVIPNGFMDLEWHPMRDAHYYDDDDTVVNPWDADRLTLTPEITEDVYTLYEGSILVPKSIGIQPNIDAALGNAELLYGMGGYTVMTNDPFSIKCPMIDTMSPWWKNGNTMFIVDTAF